MHIHGNAMNVNAANLYSAAQGERAAAAERAAEVRKRLLKALQGWMPRQAPRRLC